MATDTTQTEDEDLIILDDNFLPGEEKTNSDITIDTPILSDNEIIDFSGGDNEITSSTPEVAASTETPTLETKDSGGELDLGDLIIDTPEAITPIEAPTLEENNISSDISGNLSIEDDSSTSKGDDGTKGDDSSNLNSILDDTISKLASRQEVISTTKTNEQDNIKDLKSQIGNLEDLVIDSEKEVSELNTESRKISTNIKSLEKMKVSSVKDEIKETQTKTRVKAHNNKRTR